MINLKQKIADEINSRQRTILPSNFVGPLLPGQVRQHELYQTPVGVMNKQQIQTEIDRPSPTPVKQNLGQIIKSQFNVNDPSGFAGSVAKNIDRVQPIATEAGQTTLREFATPATTLLRSVNKNIPNEVQFGNDQVGRVAQGFFGNEPIKATGLGPISQSLLRGGATIGATIISPGLNQGNVPNEYTLNDPVSKGLFGNEPLKTVPGLYQEAKNVLPKENYGPVKSNLVAIGASLAPVLDLLGGEGSEAKGATKFADSALHFVSASGKEDAFARVTADQLAKLKNEVKNIDFTSELGNVHLTPISKLEGKIREVPLATFKELAPNATKTVSKLEKSTQYIKDNAGRFAGSKALEQNPEAGFIKNPFASLFKKGESLSKPEAQIGQESTDLAKSKPQSLTKTPQDISSFYNLDRLNIDKKAKDAIQAEIDNAGKQLQKTVGKTLTNKEVLDLSQNSSKILRQTVTREQTAAKIAADLKLRQQIAAVAQDGKIDKNFVDLWIKDKSAGEDIARQLQARKIGADPRSTELIDSLLNAIYKVNKNADEIAAAAKKVDFNNPAEVTKFYRQFVKPKASEWIDLLRYNSMLSSPNTHIINSVSNLQGTGLLAPVEKTLTGLIDATRAALTGAPRQYAIGEGAAYAKGYYSNLKKATQKFVDVMRGKALISQPDIRRIPLATSGVKAGIEKTLNYPLRLLEGMDQFFKALTEGGLESAQKFAASKGITRATDIAEEASSRLFRGQLHAPQQGYVLNSIDEITGLIQRARTSDNPIVSTVAKFTLPFLRTPMELFKQGIEYSPLGIATLVGASNKTEQLSKVLIGTAAAAGAATLLGQDRLTWALPTSAKQKAEFLAAGRQPYSIKIGNHWISYSKLHPALAFNFALISAIDDGLKNKHLDESQADSILSSFAKWTNFLADQSYLKSIGDFVAATKGDMGGYSKLVSNYPQQLIPFRALASWVERLTDPLQRQADTSGSILNDQMQQIMAQIPGFAEKLSPRKSTLGQPLENQNRVLNSFSPNRVTTANPSYESLFQLDQSQLKMNRLKSDIKDKIQKEIEQRIKQR